MRFAWVVASVALTSFAAAQERAQERLPGEPKKKASEAPVVESASPDRTTETFGDWSIACGAPSSGGERTCEVETTIVLRGQSAPFARLAVTRPAKDKPARIVALVPVNVSTGSPVAIVVEPGKSEVSLPFKSCVPAACVAEAEISKEQIQALRAAGKPAGELRLVDASGKSASVQVSLRGLNQALDAYFKQQDK